MSPVGSSGDEGRLVEAAARGDVAAFEALVRRYQHRVVRLCVAMLGDRADGLDAAQEVFLSVWQHLGRFQHRSSFATWLYRIATNHCVGELRRRRVARVPLVDVPATWGDPATEVEAVETLRGVADALNELTAEQRSVLLLREVEGLSYSEIAAVLEVGVAAVKSRLNRARTALALALEGRR